MEEFERKLKRAGFRARRDHSWAKTKPIDPKRKAAKARRVAARLKKMGLGGAVCLGCGSSDISTFQFDHIAGRKYDPTLWPLCEKCHEEKTYVLHLDPPQTENPNNAFAVIGRWLLNLIAYFDTAIRFLQEIKAQLRSFAEFLLDLARRGYGDELVFPT
jgi:SAM-dependent methyltransferase